MTQEKALTARIRWAAARHEPRGKPWTLVKRTVAACTEHRILGLAGEAAFFTLISLPPVLLGLVGTLGYLAEVIGPDTIRAVRETLAQGAATVLSQQAINDLLNPVLDEVLTTGRAGIISLGFIAALWSGSAALNVYIETISVVYGLSGQRTVIRQRLMSILLYTVGLLAGIVLLPLIAIGPSVTASIIPEASVAIHLLYWPVIVLGSIAALTALYSLSVPLRVPWREHFPGAALALFVWLTGSLLLRVYLDITIESSPVYGTLAAPMGVLWWLYVTAFAVLLGATINSELDSVHPRRATAEARREVDSTD